MLQSVNCIEQNRRFCQLSSSDAGFLSESPTFAVEKYCETQYADGLQAGKACCYDGGRKMLHFDINELHEQLRSSKYAPGSTNIQIRQGPPRRVPLLREGRQQDLYEAMHARLGAEPSPEVDYRR